VTTFPLLPTLTPAQPGETAEQFGTRAFGFLVTSGVPVGCIDADARAAALHFSILLVTAPDLLDATRERWQDVRHQLARRAADDQRLASTPDTPPAVASAPQGTSKGGGARVPRPTPPTRPTPPSTAVSVVTGNPLPDAATVATRLTAARQRAVQSAAQDGGAL
jgi:hypothetical protein